jgi:hypothetical protein
VLRHYAALCGSVRQCRQYGSATVRAAVCGSASGSVQQCALQCVAVRAAVCGCPAVRQCVAVRQWAAVRQCAWQCVVVCSSAASCSSASDGVWQCERWCAAVRAAVCSLCVAVRAAVCGCPAVWHYAALCGSLRQCGQCGSAGSASGSVWQCERQCAAVRTAVFGSAGGSVRLSGSDRGSVWQLGSVRQCGNVLGSVWLCAAVRLVVAV